MSGRPLRVVDARSPLAVRDALAEALAGGAPVWPRLGGAATLPPDAPLALDARDGWADDACLVIETSGSTATPKRVVLAASALRASARATAARLGEPAVPGHRPIAVGAERWLMCLPAEYVAGAQVLARSIAAGTEPALAPPGRFEPIAIAAAVEAMGEGRRFASFVPAQLVRLLDAAEGYAAAVAGATGAVGGKAWNGSPPLTATGAGRSGGTGFATPAKVDADAERVRAAIASFDAVLVGGQSTPQPLRERAAALGWRLVTTYGASETAGGCVYDGVPLDGVDVRIVDGEVRLAGEVLALGYFGDPIRTARAFVRDGDGRRWYRTGDAGRLEEAPGEGGGNRGAGGAGAGGAAASASHAPVADPRDSRRPRLQVTGRLDRVLISGGEKVLLDRVEQLVRGVEGYADAVVVPVPSREWGEVPAVVLADATLATRGRPDAAHPSSAVPAGAVADGGESLAADPGWARVRDAAAAAGRAARPAHRVRLDELPRLASGKPDRRAVAELAASVVGDG